MKQPCEICGRREGEKHLNRHGEPDRISPETPLGPIVKCPLCGRLACPDCYHECLCCEGAKKCSTA